MVGVLWAVINFEVEVVTDVGQAVSPIIIFDPNSVGNIGESTGRCRTVAADWPLQDGGSRLDWTLKSSLPLALSPSFLSSLGDMSNVQFDAYLF